jgi:hypothetical protein
MSVIRRFQTVFVLLVVVLLASPAVAACCVWSAEPMACCEKSEGERLVAACCVSSTPTPQQQPPASVAKLSKVEFGPSATLPLHVVPATVTADSGRQFDIAAGPPGSHPLYLRLSVIRR